MRNLLIASIALVSSLATAGLVRADLIYSQGWTGGPGTYWASDYASGQGGYWIFDNFRVTQPTLISGASWVGMYYNLDNPSNNPSIPDTQLWVNYFRNDASGLPGGFVASQAFSAGNVNRTQLGAVSFGGILIPIFEFSVTYATPFLATANTTYWFSTLSYSPTLNPYWFWAPSNLGLDSSSMQYVIDQNSQVSGPYLANQNRAFAFEGMVVPVPSGLLLSLMACIVLAGYSRYRVRKSHMPQEASLL